MEKPQRSTPSQNGQSGREQAKTNHDEDENGQSAQNNRGGCLGRLQHGVLKTKAKLELDSHTLLLMFKGSLPPIISIALLQIPSLAATLSTVGYLIPIVTVLASTISPRGRFLKTLFFHLLSACMAAAMGMLLLYCGVQARLATSAGITPNDAFFPQPYNASQSAVCGVFLFFNIWLVNSLRARWAPEFGLPAMVYSLFINITSTFGVHFVSIGPARVFIMQVFTSMLLGLGIATAVSIFVVPDTSRRIYGRCLVRGFGLVRQAVDLQRKWISDLEQARDDGGPLRRVETSVGRSDGASPRKGGRHHQEPARDPREETAHELREKIVHLRDLAGKTYREARSAKRDFAYGKLTAHHLGELYWLFRKVFIPVIGMSTIMDIFHGASEGSFPLHPRSEDDDESQAEPKEIWNDIMRRLHEPFNQLSSAIGQGLEHAAIQLELISRPKRKGALDGDIEAHGAPQPGDQGFSSVVREKVHKFSISRTEILREWACEQGLLENEELDGCLKKRRQAQLFVILYIEQLMHAAGQAVQELTEFADARIADGTMSTKHLIVPGLTKLKKWTKEMFGEKREFGTSAEDGPDGDAGQAYMGFGFGHGRDPEHLPPETKWERIGDGIRTVSRFASSRESMFGLRVALAVMTTAILCYLERTQVFFQEQRIVWAMVITGFAMTQTAGQTIFGFFERVGGSALAMVAALIAWYIVDGHTPGVIIMLWIFLFLQYYLFIKYPRYTPTWTIATITEVLIIAYALQVRTIGVATAERSGQPYYPTYLFGPYRLATVAAGCFVAFLWTVLPSPVTDRTWLRRDLSAVMYLLANYVSAIHETLRLTLTRGAGDVYTQGTPAARLFKVRTKIYSKLMLLLPSLELHSRWQRYEPIIGGRFPRARYDEIILRSNRIMNYLTLMSYTVAWTPREEKHTLSEEAAIQQEAWNEAMAEMAETMGPTNFSLVSTLTLLSNSMLSGQCLPPHIPLPKPFEMTRRLMSVQEDRYGDDGYGQARARGTGDLDDGSEHLLQVSDSRPRTADSRHFREQDLPVPGSRPRSGTHTPRAARIQNLLDPTNMEQRGYTGFAVLQVCSTLLTDDLRGLVDAVSSLVGVVDFSVPGLGSESSDGSGSGGMSFVESAGGGGVEERGDRSRRKKKD